MLLILLNYISFEYFSKKLKKKFSKLEKIILIKCFKEVTKI